MGRSEGALVDGTWGTELLDGLGRSPDDVVVTKKRPSAFFQTDLFFVLQSLGITELIVGGVSTNWAVESTVRDGHSWGYNMVVVREATATPFADMHEPSLKSMGTVFARVTTLQDILASA
jgi:nicotinamidase-related amidase